MLTLCLPAAGIQEEEAVAIGGGGREGRWEEEDSEPSLHQRLLFGHI
jgi:hypothetical protein